MSASKTKVNKRSVQSLPILQPKVAGIDLGACEHYVCGPALISGEPNVRVFQSATPQLIGLIAWLQEQGVKSVAMESTGIYWIPLYELLEASGIEPILVNARELCHVPGRKTDVQDCQWIQLLHSCGLLHGSFRPSEGICRCRALTRQCANLVEERSKTVNWMQKALDQMNVQVHRALTDITGKTGLAIVHGIVEGQRGPKVLARLRDSRCGKNEEEIAEHLTGTWKSEHLFNLKMALKLYDQLQAQITDYEQELHKELLAMTPQERKNKEAPEHPKAAKRKAIRNRGEQEDQKILWQFSGVDLTRIDGISAGVSQVILTEVGFNLSDFSSKKHFVSWLRLCPKMGISGGKALKKKPPRGTGSNRVAGILRMAAVSLSRSHSSLGAEYRRVARRRSGAVAVFALARKLAILIYRMLRYGQDYVDEGEKVYQKRFKARRFFSMAKTAKELGYQLVSIRCWSLVVAGGSTPKIICTMCSVVYRR
ncbi:MAG: IS110 family transposase [Kiritimatiellae bacterium]|nr:IS110 family transposase [Kiritimatiellia bacterium]